MLKCTASQKAGLAFHNSTSVLFNFSQMHAYTMRFRDIDSIDLAAGSVCCDDSNYLGDEAHFCGRFA